MNAMGSTFGNKCSRTIRVSAAPSADRKSTRLNSSHSQISYAVFCLKKKSTDNNDGATFQAASDHRRPIYAMAKLASMPRVVRPSLEHVHCNDVRVRVLPLLERRRQI